MKVLIVGSGGREHAIAWSCSKSQRVDKIYCAPGNAGIAEYAELVDIKAMEFDKLVAFAKEKGGIDYAERRMEELHAEAVALLDSISKDDSPEKQDVKRALLAYLDFVIKREK